MICMRQTTRMHYPSMSYNFATLFNCTTVVQVSEWVTSTSVFCLGRLTTDYCCLWSGQEGPNLWVSFALYSNCYWAFYFLSIQFSVLQRCFTDLPGQTPILSFWTALELSSHVVCTAARSIADILMRIQVAVNIRYYRCYVFWLSCKHYG